MDVIGNKEITHHEQCRYNLEEVLYEIVNNILLKGKMSYDNRKR
jgi:hypothetical protein